jgi:uncharacterized protein YndB with AHSA1/START domain
MTDRNVIHASFTIERVLKASPQRVFAAFADPAAKQAWCYCDAAGKRQQMELDFRVGGRERATNYSPDGVAHVFDGVYLDIVENERFIVAFTMNLDARKISASIITAELRAEGEGTRLLFTEQGAFLDGYDEIEDREHGTDAGLDALERWLEAGRAA